MVEASSASGQVPVATLEAPGLDAAAEQALSFTGPPALGLIVILLKVVPAVYYVFKVDILQVPHPLNPLGLQTMKVVKNIVKYSICPFEFHLDSI